MRLGLITRPCLGDFIWSDPRRRAGKQRASSRCCFTKRRTAGRLFWITRADGMTTTRRQALLSALGIAVGQGMRAQPNPELDQALSLPDFEALAHKHISHGAWERIQGGAADEITIGWNREAYSHIRLRPRVLLDVSKLDTRIKLFGQELPFPI